MTKIDSKQSMAFIVVFFIIAFLINSTQHRSYNVQNIRLQQTVPTQAPGISQQQQQIEVQQEAAAQKAAADHASFLARYLNSGFSKTPGSESLALVVATQGGKLDHTLATALADHFKSDTVKISTSFFKPEFVSDKLFANVFDGSTELLKKLELANSLDGLLLARETVQYVKNPESLDNVITANMTLEVQVVPVAGNIQNQTWQFTATGAGFSLTEAESNAEERLIKQISNDTKMSLSN